MINALEDYHSCTICSTLVHDYGPDADAVNIYGTWYHATCYRDLMADARSAVDRYLEDLIASGAAWACSCRIPSVVPMTGEPCPECGRRE